MESRVVVIGSGGHSKVVCDAIVAGGRYQLAGLLDDFRDQGSPTWGPPLIGGIAALPGLGITRGVIAVGDNWRRFEIYEQVQKLIPSFEFVTIVHPFTAVSKESFLGAGTVVLAGAVINPGTKIGAHTIVNTRAAIDHDNSIGDFASIAPGATLGGSVTVGDFSAVGLGASVRHGTAIGQHTVIGMGAAVVAEVGSHAVAYGVPAQVMRSRMPGEAYL